MTIKHLTKAVLASVGLELTRIPDFGRDPYRDIKALMNERERPIVIDVGANIGQSALAFARTLNAPIIHAFEPGPATYSQLQRATARIRDITLNYCALGAATGQQEFYENTHPDMSSFLELGASGWGVVNQRRHVDVTTLDRYCEQRGINRIDLLKTDTQGYDLEVLKGARQLLSKRAVRLILIEINILPIYKHAPRLDQVFSFLTHSNFSLISFYNIRHCNGVAGWMDALFVCQDS
jgi:FkbM family methyltransferase